MSQIVSEQFNQSLRSSPSGQRKSGTMFDEIYGALETSENPLDRVIQMIAEFHGVWTGGSQELFQFSSFLASLTNSPELKQMSNKIGNAACQANDIASQLPPSKVGRQNNEFAAIMPAPLLREFVNFAHNIHPALNIYFQLHNGNFPYFQQISEEVGRFAHITMRATEIAPLLWPKMGGVSCLSTNSRMDANTLLKMFPSMFYQMDNASNLLNSLYLRSMRPENNMSLLQPDYGQDKTLTPEEFKKKKTDFKKRSTDTIAEAEELLASPDASSDQIEAMEAKLKSLNAEAKELAEEGKEVAKSQKTASKSKPKAHGHNYAMDVFGAKRRVDAVPGSAAVVMEKSGDSLRLINKFFPTRQIGRYKTEEFEISLNHGPNGEPMTFITDSRGRLMNNTTSSNSIDDPTNERVITSQEEFKDEKR